MTIVIGIDPGKSGAVAIREPIADERRAWTIRDTPTAAMTRGKLDYFPAEMVRILRPYAAHSTEVIVAIENVHAMPGQGVVSMFAFGRGLGLWIGILAALQLPYELVEPATWKRKLHMPAGATKAKSVAVAQQLLPAIADSFVGPRGGALDGRAEAALLAVWMMQKRAVAGAT